MNIKKESKIKQFILLFLLLSVVQLSFAQEFKYKWQQQYYGILNGERSLLFSNEMRNSKLAFADIDFDGDEDIFLGMSNGEIAFFENRGTNASSDFVLVTQQYKAIFEIKKEGRKTKIRNTIDVGERSAPALIDIDNDGDFDLFIGSAEGNIWFFENQGNNLVPEFRLVTPRFSNINVGQNSVPIFADVNLKRKFDLLIGTVDGKVWLFMNEGTRKKPDFLKYSPELVSQFGLETHASPGLIDWDEDGDLDLVVGQKNGTLSYFENEGDRFYPKWVFKEQSFQLIDIGGESAPYFVDMDNDNDDDLIIGSANPTVFYYENRMQDDNRVLWNKSTNMFRFHKLIVTGNRASLALGDLDKDGDFDLIIGEQTGNLNHYENQGNNKQPNWVLKTEELIFMTGVENSAPTLGDLDDDGDLDLLIGEKQGQIILVMNVGTPKSPKWELRDKTYFQIDAGSNSVPFLFDLDGDGDLDLLIGNYAGRIIQYLNNGTKKEPQFALESTRYASAKVANNAAPTLFDWNQDEYQDLIIGGEEGKLQLIVSPGKVGEEGQDWSPSEKAFFSFNAYTLSHPFIHDFDDDGLKDLIVGNDFGDFVLYLNKGKEEEKAEEQVNVDNSIDQQAGSLVVEDVEGRVEVEIEPEPELDETQALEDQVLITVDSGPERIKADPIFERVRTPLIKNDKISRSVPTMGDIDQDGDLDLIIGSRSGSLYQYENKGTDINWKFELVNEDLMPKRGRKNSAPLLFDLDQDGDLDLIVGMKTGRLSFYLNQGTSEEANFVEDENIFDNLWLDKNSKPAVIDIDRDGLYDLLVGGFKGKLIHVRNDSTRFNILRRDYHHIDTNIGSTPFFADIGNSDQMDLMVGSDEGMIFFFRNENPELMGEWKIIPKIDKNLIFPKGTSPIAHDIDNDGDLDLITGSESGPVILYRNDAVIREEILETGTEIATEIQ